MAGGTELDAIWRAYSDRYPGLRSVVERTVRAVYAECEATREARLNARAEIAVAEMRASQRAVPADCNPGFAARRGDACD